MWRLYADRPGAPHIEEEVDRQGTAYRRARQLYAAGYDVTGVQMSSDDPAAPLAVYRFDGIRFVRIPKG
jgi:hypothetical protein